MDSVNASRDHSTVKFEQPEPRPEVTMPALRQKLVELRRQAKLHEHQALSDCLALAISLTANKHTN